MKEYDIVIIGGGILGISHAYHCIEAGYSVALMERNAYPMDATVRNFGQVVPSGFGVKWQQYGLESLRIYKSMQEKVDLTVRQEGTIYLASNTEEEELISELNDINRSQGYTSTLLTKNECLTRYPGIREDYVKAGLFFPEEIVVDPRLMARRFLDFMVEHMGLDYFPQSPIYSVDKTDKVKICSKNNFQLAADKVFLCCGAEYEMLFPELFDQSDILLVKLQMLETKPQSQVRIPGSVLTGWTIRRYESFHECPSFSEIKSKEDSEHYQRKHGVHILFKQSQDGSVVIGDSHHYQPVKEGSRMDYLVNNDLNMFMIDEAKKIYDLDSYALRNTWTGFYSQCKTRDIFNETINEDIHIVTAIGGKGMTGSLGYAQENVAQTLSLNKSMI